jgi:REase_DpnII-MboI
MQTSAAARGSAWGTITELAGTDNMTRAAAQATALTYLLRDTATMRLGSPSVEDLARVLESIGRSMRRWPWEAVPRTVKSAPARWDIENEYHVQDMLWVILAPLLPDLDDEEWLKSLGQHHPRADLAIPSLELIIEVKFLRSGKSSFSSVIQEVAADASTYLQVGSGYRHIIAFVWDDAARTEEHSELRQGLTRISGVRDAIVLSRPSKMVRNSDRKG